METLRFHAGLLERPDPSGIDVQTSLAHFAIVTYMVDPIVLCRHIHKRFEPDCIMFEGRPRALVSVVPFMDEDFHFVRCRWPKWNFCQTNYRAYVTDTETGEHVAWFFGTSLDSVSVYLPRFVWKLPWHRARINFDCDYDVEQRKYSTYRMATTRSWADAHLEICDSGVAPHELAGFTDLETGLVLLTHPLRGYYFRRDGKPGSYSVWHERLQTTTANVISARFSLLDRLGLVPLADTSSLHSVLVQPKTDFTIYLPPKSVLSMAK